MKTLWSSSVTQRWQTRSTAVPDLPQPSALGPTKPLSKHNTTTEQPPSQTHQLCGDFCRSNGDFCRSDVTECLHISYNFFFFFKKFMWSVVTLEEKVYNILGQEINIIHSSDECDFFIWWNEGYATPMFDCSSLSAWFLSKGEWKVDGLHKKCECCV